MLLAVGLCSSCVINGNGDFYSVFSGPKYEEEFHETFFLEKGGDLTLKNVNGAISIETWSREEVEITAVKKAGGSKKYLDRAQIKINASDRSIEIDTVYEKRRNLRVSVTYTLVVPENTNLKFIKSTNGRLKLSGPFLSIKAYDLEGNIHAGTTNGSIYILLRALTDNVTAKTTNGGIKMALDSPVDADLTLRTSNGRIHVDMPVTIEKFSSSRRRLDGRIGNGGPEISLKTVNGSIRLVDSKEF